MPLTTNDDSRVEDYFNSTGCDEGNNVISFPWDSGTICWDNNPFCWDDVAIVLEVIAGGKVIGTDEGWLGAYDKLDEPKKKRFIHLVAKVKGENDIYKGKKEKKENVKLTAREIKLTVEAVAKRAGIKIEIDNKEK